MTRKLVLLLLFCSLLTISSCGPKTKIAMDWSNPDYGKVRFNKVVAIAMSKDPIIRRVAEDEFVDKLPKGTEGLASYALVPEDKRDDVDFLKKVLKEANVDGAAVFSLVSEDMKFEFNRGNPHYNFWSYYGWAYPTVYGSSYLMTETVLRIYCAVYEVENATLVWSALSETTNADSTKKTIDDIVRKTIVRLKREGIVG
jgi:hypothetical protein